MNCPKDLKMIGLCSVSEANQYLTVAAALAKKPLATLIFNTPRYCSNSSIEQYNALCKSLLNTSKVKRTRLPLAPSHSSYCVFQVGLIDGLPDCIILLGPSYKNPNQLVGHVIPKMSKKQKRSRDDAPGDSKEKESERSSKKPRHESEKENGGSQTGSHEDPV